MELLIHVINIQNRCKTTQARPASYEVRNYGTVSRGPIKFLIFLVLVDQSQNHSRAMSFSDDVTDSIFF